MVKNALQAQLLKAGLVDNKKAKKLSALLNSKGINPITTTAYALASTPNDISYDLFE